MTIKPFAIQGADLTLGGVNLQAGTTGVVIPGVTQAADYFVEEVERLITIGGNNPNTFGSNVNAVTVIDNSRYLVLTGTTPGQGYVPAEYSVDELDDGRIEEITVETAGVFLTADKNRAEAADMWATTTPTPFVSFNTANWTQIPFRPKMRAGAVENVGGGNANTGNFTFNANTIANDNDASIVVGGSSLGNIEVQTVDELVPPGGIWRLFIDEEEYPTLGTTVQIGDTVTTSWGTPITATITDIQQDGNWQIHVDQDITAGHNDYDTVTFSTVVTTKTWTFGTDGDLYIPPGKTIRDAMSGDNLLGGADAAVSYKGFKAVYARMYDDEPTISKVLIYQDTVTTTPTLEVDPSTDDDLFKVSGLANSSVIALVNIYGADDTYPTALSTLQHFAKSIIDNVILVEGSTTTAAEMKTAFYNNFNTFASRAGNRYKDFKFTTEEWFNIPGGGGSGTGATFDIFRNRYEDYLANVDTGNSQGINYQEDDVVTILGTALGGVAPDNNIVVTVTGVGAGGQIESWDYAGTPPNSVFPLDNIEDGGNDQYDGANYIYTNIQGNSRQDGDNNSQWAVNYNNGDVNESGDAWFGTGSEYVATYNDSIFGLFVTGADIDWIATDGNSGFDGDGQADTGSLQLADTDGLINGDQSFVLNADGSVTFPDGTTQTTAHTEGDPNVWVQEFETLAGTLDDRVFAANSVEYLANGDIVAVFLHGLGDFDSRYNSIGRFTPTGEKVWSMKFQGAQYTDGWGLAVDNANGFIYVAGESSVGAGYNVATLTKLAQADGAVVWSKTYDVGYDNTNVVVDVGGNDYHPVVVGYAYNGTDNQIVTTKINSTTGNFIWSKALDGQGDEEAYGMAVDINNGDEVVTVGYMTQLGEGEGADTDNQMLVVKYDNAGAIQWQRAIQVEAGYDCNGADAAVDSRGNIYVCGNFEYDNNGNTDSAIIIIKLNSLGNKMWTRKVQGPCEDFASSIVVGPDNCLYLSAFTSNAPVDYSMVIAKYNLDGTVAWQRILDNTTTWTFAGSFFFGSSGFSGSTLAVRSGYVAVVGSFGDPFATAPRAVVAQFDTDGRVFTRGNYDFIPATFSGLLNTTASNITVAAAGKTDINLDSDDITVGDFEPTFDLASDLMGTVYRKIIADNELRNGVRVVSLSANGSVTLPAGGTVSEGYVTSNPTIQLTPARPDVASQKLVIKGGGISYYPENGIDVEVNYTTRAVGETLTVSVNSDTYASQTLYWWINPEGVGISDPESGTVTLNGSGFGSFSIVVDSDDYEFNVRVSPEDHNYGPGVIGAQSPLINSGEPTFNYEHHLHLTTGNLAETSIFLGTDNHNVRTTTTGGIEITTPDGNSTNVWEFSTDGEIKGGPGGVNKVDLSWELILTSDKTIKINPGADGVVSPTFFGFNSDGSGGGIALPAGSSIDDRLTGVLISGAGLLEVNRFYPKVSNTLYEAVDAGVTYRLIDQAGTWSLDVVGANNPQYTSTNLITWANAGGGLPAPTGEFSTRETTLTVGTSTWVFGNDGKLTAPGNLQVDGGKIILNTGGNAYVESVDYGVNSANSAVNIFGGPYQKIKLRAGFGTEATWTFGTDGKLAKLDGLTLTAGGQFNICTIVTSGSGYNTGNALKATTGGSGTGMTVGIGYGLSNQLSNVDVVDPGTGYVDGDVITVSEGTGGTFVLTRYNNQANQGNNNTVEFNWTFGTNGRLTLPGALVKSTVAKTGAINPGIDKVATVSIEPTYDATWVNSHSVSNGGFSCDIAFPSAGNPVFGNIVDTVGNRTVGDTLATVLGSALGITGVNGVNDMVIKVATLTTTIATALDLTKSVNKLTNGSYTLANGVEGQIMYLVRQTAATAHNLIVASARVDGTTYTDVSFSPFTDGTDPTNMVTLIFTDSAWQSMGGVWNFT